MPLASLVRRVDELSGGKLGKLVDEVGQRERVDLRIRLERMKYLFPWQDPARRKIEKEKGILSWDVFKPFAGRVPRYILERGIPKEICKEFQLGYDEARKRVVFPVLDEEGNFVGMQGRAVLPGIEPTWYTYPPFQKAKHVYGLNRVRGGQVILMEGVIDVLKWTAYGIKGCVSLFGSMPSEVQLSKIARMGLPVWMAWDGDEAGRKADRATVAFLKNRVPLYRIRIPEGKDPDDLTPEQARVAIAKKEMVLG
jgi:DNA primase